MLGHGAVTGEMHVYICVCDETCKYSREIFLGAFPQDSYFPVCWSNISFILLRMCHVYGCGNSGLFILEMLQCFSLFNRGFVVVG